MEQLDCTKEKMKMTNMMIGAGTLEEMALFLQDDSKQIYRYAEKGYSDYPNEYVKIPYVNEGYIHIVNTTAVSSHSPKRLNTGRNNIEHAFLYFPKCKTAVLENWHQALRDQGRHPTGEEMAGGVRFIHLKALRKEIDNLLLKELQRKEATYRSRFENNIELIEDKMDRFRITSEFIANGPSRKFEEYSLEVIKWENIFRYLDNPDIYIEESILELEKTERIAHVVTRWIAEERVHKFLSEEYEEKLTTAKKLQSLLEGELSQAKTISIKSKDGKEIRTENAIYWNMMLVDKDLLDQSGVGGYRDRIRFENIESIKYRKKEYLIRNLA